MVDVYPFVEPSILTRSGEGRETGRDDAREAAMNSSKRWEVRTGSGRDARKCLRREVSVRGSLCRRLASRQPSPSR